MLTLKLVRMKQTLFVLYFVFPCEIQCHYHLYGVLQRRTP